MGIRRVAIPVAVVMLLVVGCALTPRPSTTESAPTEQTSQTAGPIESLTPPPPSTPAKGTPTQLLADLTIAPEHLDGYDRDLFPLWIDADHDGCNTRKEVLLDEAVTPPTVGAKCSLTGGSWFSIYDGQTLHDAAQVEIDHVVALAEAWYSGAWAWTTQRREQYANDLGVPDTLVVSSHSSNQSKGSDDPAGWIPPRAADLCPYVSSWVKIKTRWSLAIDPAEHDALAGYLGACPDEVVVVPRA